MEILEEEEQASIRGFLRYDQLQNAQQSGQLKATGEL